nr:MAG TPA: hypothetical protein [Caudoviricetes sp.]
MASSCFPIGYNVSTLAPMVRTHHPSILSPWVRDFSSIHNGSF